MDAPELTFGSFLVYPRATPSNPTYLLHYRREHHDLILPLLPDGQPEALLPDGQPEALLPDGQPEALLPDGPPEALLPDGPPEALLPDGPLPVALLLEAEFPIGNVDLPPPPVPKFKRPYFKGGGTRTMLCPQLGDYGPCVTNCKYAHSDAELIIHRYPKGYKWDGSRARLIKYYKMISCTYFEKTTRFCPYGAACIYFHVTSEQRFGKGHVIQGVECPLFSKTGVCYYEIEKAGRCPFDH